MKYWILFMAMLYFLLALIVGSTQIEHYYENDLEIFEINFLLVNYKITLTNSLEDKNEKKWNKNRKESVDWYI